MQRALASERHRVRSQLKTTTRWRGGVGEGESESPNSTAKGTVLTFTCATESLDPGKHDDRSRGGSPRCPQVIPPSVEVTATLTPRQARTRCTRIRRQVPSTSGRGEGRGKRKSPCFRGAYGAKPSSICSQARQWTRRDVTPMDTRPTPSPPSLSFVPFLSFLSFLSFLFVSLVYGRRGQPRAA